MLWVSVMENSPLSVFAFIQPIAIPKASRKRKKPLPENIYHKAFACSKCGKRQKTNQTYDEYQLFQSQEVHLCDVCIRRERSFPEMTYHQKACLCDSCFRVRWDIHVVLNEYLSGNRFSQRFLCVACYGKLRSRWKVDGNHWSIRCDRTNK